MVLRALISGESQRQMEREHSSPFAPKEIPLGDKGEAGRGMGSKAAEFTPIPTPPLPLHPKSVSFGAKGRGWFLTEV